MTMTVHFETYVMMRQLETYIWEKISDCSIIIGILKLWFYVNIIMGVKLAYICRDKSDEEFAIIIKEMKKCFSCFDEIKHYSVIC